MHNWAAMGCLAFGCLVVLYIGQRMLSSRTPYPLPPGPPSIPWVGNVIGINKDAPWLTYTEWARKYGDLVYSRLLGKDIIIINSEKVAKDLLEVRSKNYSDRPYLITNELCGIEFNSSFMPYGNRWRLHRRFFHQTFRFDAVPRFLPYQHSQAHHLVQRLLETPEKLGDHIFEYTTSVILNSTYNYDSTSHNDNLVDIVANVLDVIVPALRPDVAVILGAFPWLHYFPSWFPGMSFKKEMAVARAYSKQYLERPFEYALRKSSKAVPSMVHDALRRAEEEMISPEESWIQALKEASGTAFLAGSETSKSVLMTFFLMMMVNPAVQEKAQAEIDTAVGRDRLPTMDDRPLLPLVDAIFRETLRYNPILPLSAPHATVDDDVHDGYYIPKGAILLTNLWSMAHDESRYPNPEAFMPERFLNDDGSLKPDDMEHIMFGFGRRICVARHFAVTTAWVAIATILAVYKILRPLDENGVETLVEPKFSSGIGVHPLPFKCRIVPRFDGMDAGKLEKLIAASIAVG